VKKLIPGVEERACIYSLKSVGNMQYAWGIIGISAG
jgi:hypothetical protein